MSKIVKKFVFIPESVMAALHQFDTLEQAIALEGTKLRGVLVEASRTYDVNIPKEPKFLFLCVGQNILDRYVGQNVYVAKSVAQFGLNHSAIKLVKIVQITPESFMLVGTKDGDPYSIALNKAEHIAVQDDVFGITFKEYTDGNYSQSVCSANKQAQTSGHIQKPAVVTTGITAASYQPVGGTVTPVKKNQYRYMKYTKQGAFIGEVSPETTDRKTLQALFERQAKTTGHALDNSTLTVEAFGFIWRRSKVR